MVGGWLVVAFIEFVSISATSGAPPGGTSAGAPLQDHVINLPFSNGETPRYVSNFISIHRLRPGNADEDGTCNPDDIFDDEEEIGRASCRERV